jgi:hypothetical protein
MGVSDNATVAIAGYTINGTDCRLGKQPLLGSWGTWDATSDFIRLPPRLPL